MRSKNFVLIFSSIIYLHFIKLSISLGNPSIRNLLFSQPLFIIALFKSDIVISALTILPFLISSLIISANLDLESLYKINSKYITIE